MHPVAAVATALAESEADDDGVDCVPALADDEEPAENTGPVYEPSELGG